MGRVDLGSTCTGVLFVGKNVALLGTTHHDFGCGSDTHFPRYGDEEVHLLCVLKGSRGFFAELLSVLDRIHKYSLATDFRLAPYYEHYVRLKSYRVRFWICGGARGPSPRARRSSALHMEEEGARGSRSVNNAISRHRWKSLPPCFCARD